MNNEQVRAAAFAEVIQYHETMARNTSGTRVCYVHHDSIKAIRALATSAAPDCQQDQFSSRMCEKGTKCCVTVHPPERSGKLAGEQHAWGRNMLMGIDINATAPQADSSSAAPSDRGPWRYDTDLGAEFACRYFVESNDFTHDVRLYINGDFADDAKRAQYGETLARRLNATPSPTRESLSASGDYVAYLRGEFERYAEDNGVPVPESYDPGETGMGFFGCFAAGAALATPRQTKDGGLSAATGEVLWRYQYRSADGWFTQYEADEPAPSSDTRNIVKFVLAPKEPAAQGGVPEAARESLYMAAIKCGHKIDDETVTLYRDTQKDGNALSQLADRLTAAAAPTGASHGE